LAAVADPTGRSRADRAVAGDSVDAARSKSAYFRLLAHDPDILAAQTGFVARFWR
jgi:hypothetical protein